MPPAYRPPSPCGLPMDTFWESGVPIVFLPRRLLGGFVFVDRQFDGDLVSGRGFVQREIDGALHIDAGDVRHLPCPFEHGFGQVGEFCRLDAGSGPALDGEHRGVDKLGFAAAHPFDGDELFWAMRRHVETDWDSVEFGLFGQPLRQLGLGVEHQPPPCSVFSSVLCLAFERFVCKSVVLTMPCARGFEPEPMIASPTYPLALCMPLAVEATRLACWSISLSTPEEVSTSVMPLRWVCILILAMFSRRFLSLVRSCSIRSESCRHPRGTDPRPPCIHGLARRWSAPAAHRPCSRAGNTGWRQFGCCSADWSRQDSHHSGLRRARCPRSPALFRRRGCCLRPDRSALFAAR
nr:MAG TPA: hypothetical protein [Caudoviricetes sp.]